MEIFYLAQLPEKSSLRIMLQSDAGWEDEDGEMRDVGLRVKHLVGRWSSRVREISYTPGSQPAPHCVLAALGTDEQNILNFTSEWGVLGWSILRPGVRERLGIDFSMNLEAWRRQHARTNELLGLAASHRERDKKKLSRLFALAQRAEMKAGELRPVVESGRALRLKLVATSLWDALLMMLWLDLGATQFRVLQCADPACRRFFTTDRPNRIYCETACAARVAKRKWWRKKGAQRRASSRAQAE